MKKKRVLFAATVLVIVSVFLLYSYSSDTYHFSGKGEYFDAGVNSTPGKYIELVIYSTSKTKIENIEYNLKGFWGLNGSGTISLNEDGYYIGSIKGSKININRLDTITLELKWNGNTETIKLKNEDN